MSAPALLSLTGITKRFGETLALDDVSFTVRAGTVHALVGENGAGKTTLMRAAFGMIAVDQGRVAIAGARSAPRSPSDALRAGIGMVHQHFTNVPAMRVYENVALGGRGVLDASRARRRVREIGERTGLTLDADARVGDLPVGAQQRLEIVKALARDVRVLILDEPTAVLAPAEADELLGWMRRFADAGNAAVLITHKLAEALGVATEVTVLRQGRTVLSAPAVQLTTHDLAAAMLGAEPAVERAASRIAPGERVAAIDAVDVVDERGVPAVRAATLELREREIVGIAAVEGAGQRALLRLLAGRVAAVSGRVSLPARVAFVPEDRHRDAMVLDFSPTENVALDGAGAARGPLPWRRLAERTAQLVRDFDVRGAGDARSVRTLSGGNQQKLVLARELATGPRLVVVENPTRGLDIRAAQEVRERLRAAAAAGAAVVVYSSDLDEVLALATRVVVMHAGVLRAVPKERTAVGRAMLGLDPEPSDHSGVGEKV